MKGIWCYTKVKAKRGRSHRDSIAIDVGMQKGYRDLAITTLEPIDARLLVGEPTRWRTLTGSKRARNLFCQISSCPSPVFLVYVASVLRSCTYRTRRQDVALSESVRYSQTLLSRSCLACIQHKIGDPPNFAEHDSTSLPHFRDIAARRPHRRNLRPPRIFASEVKALLIDATCRLFHDFFSKISLLTQRFSRLMLNCTYIHFASLYIWYILKGVSILWVLHDPNKSSRFFLLETFSRYIFLRNVS